MSRGPGQNIENCHICIMQMVIWFSVFYILSDTRAAHIHMRKIEQRRCTSYAHYTDQHNDGLKSGWKLLTFSCAPIRTMGNKLILGGGNFIWVISQPPPQKNHWVIGYWGGGNCHHHFHDFSDQPRWAVGVVGQQTPTATG